MKRFALLCLLGGALGASSLQIVSVERSGLPPYPPGARVYRLEGTECPSLRVGELLVLKREGERRRMGRLVVLSVHADHAKAALAVPGETYPLKGDAAVRLDRLRDLPGIPARLPAAPLPASAQLSPRRTVRALPRMQTPTYREPIYFLKGDGSLSPGALEKLQRWVDQWGLQGRWVLEGPQGLSTLLQERLSVLRAELQRLGVSVVEIRAVAQPSPGRYDAIYVIREPW